VRATVTAIQAAAQRDGIPVLRVLSGLVVVEATPSALDALQNVEGVLSISLDNLVTPAMSISDRPWRRTRLAQAAAACSDRFLARRP
jgi:hypothetical protein